MYKHAAKKIAAAIIHTSEARVPVYRDLSWLTELGTFNSIPYPIIVQRKTNMKHCYGMWPYQNLRNSKIKLRQFRLCDFKMIPSPHFASMTMFIMNSLQVSLSLCLMIVVFLCFHLQDHFNANFLLLWAINQYFNWNRLPRLDCIINVSQFSCQKRHSYAGKKSFLKLTENAGSIHQGKQHVEREAIGVSAPRHFIRTSSESRQSETFGFLFLTCILS